MMKNQFELNQKDMREEQNTQEPLDFALVMSLALDGMLDAQEERQFRADLERYPLLAEQWQRWQEMDARILAEPAIAPPADFLDKVSARLAKEQRRKQLWFGMLVGWLSVCLWVIMITGLLAGGMFILSNQGPWLADQVRNITHLVNTWRNWQETLAGTAGAMASMPQTWLIAMGYLTLTATILAYWTRFLRRSTQALSA
ncbi:MAG: hypothetical protein KDE47_00950 [Caldilineaceae bacterium]|nr:hypothetical protein [Caldilineaceae bacterium]